jgi:hypothetical protein
MSAESCRRPSGESDVFCARGRRGAGRTGAEFRSETHARAARRNQARCREWLAQLSVTTVGHAHRAVADRGETLAGERQKDLEIQRAAQRVGHRIAQESDVEGRVATQRWRRAAGEKRAQRCAGCGRETRGRPVCDARKARRISGAAASGLHAWSCWGRGERRGASPERETLVSTKNPSQLSQTQQRRPAFARSALSSQRRRNQVSGRARPRAAAEQSCGPGAARATPAHLNVDRGSTPCGRGRGGGRGRHLHKDNADTRYGLSVHAQRERGAARGRRALHVSGKICAQSITKSSANNGQFDALGEERTPGGPRSP